MSLLTWIIDTEPKSVLDRREWPMAIYSGQMKKPAAFLLCESRYTDYVMRSRNHLPISLVICRHIDDTFRKMLYRDKAFRSVDDAIQFTEQFLPQRPEWHPIIF